MKAIITVVTMLILSSCCSPHFVGYINPLYLEPDGYEETCPLQPCKPGEACPGKGIPWLNLEYEYADQHYGKFGASYLGYTQNAIISLTGNYLTNIQNQSSLPKKNGFGLETQLGVLPVNNYCTKFFGIEMNHFTGKYPHNQYHPKIGYAIPFKILNSIQFKTGYQFNVSSNKNFWTFGVNFKTPIYPLLKK